MWNSNPTKDSNSGVLENLSARANSVAFQALRGRAGAGNIPVSLQRPQLTAANHEALPRTVIGSSGPGPIEAWGHPSGQPCMALGESPNPNERYRDPRGRNSSRIFQLAATPHEGEGWTGDEVQVISRANPEEIPESRQTFLPCFVALADDLETLELPGYSRSDVKKRAES